MPLVSMEWSSSQRSLSDTGEIEERRDADCPYQSDSIARLKYLGEGPVSPEASLPFPEIYIYPNRDYTFGRENCSYNISDRHAFVSKRHFRIYTVVYEKHNPEFQPLVYCEDFQSTNGTFVNGNLIGQFHQERVAYLLADGDIIEIKPSWRFRFNQPKYNRVLADKGRLTDIIHIEDRVTISDRILGQGQYGTVFLAKEVATSVQVACKIIDLEKSVKELIENNSLVPGHAWHKRQAREGSAIQKIRREIDILATLSHPHIINLKKAFCSETNMYIITELAPGGDLFSYVEAHNGCLQDIQARSIAYQLMHAVNYIHSKGIVHRDIKTENVLILQADFGGRVVLTDFGFANHARSGRLMSKVGTPGYAAREVDHPEKWAPNGYTKAVDLWSFGVLTAFMLTGERLELKAKYDRSEQENEVVIFCARMAKRSNAGFRSVDFVRNLLILEENLRISAPDALLHAWFTLPLSEAAEAETAYAKTMKYWRKRDQDDSVIENIPSGFIPPYSRENSTLRRRKRLPDATSSPYFGLDRHLHLKVPSKRNQILAELKTEGSSFVNEQSQVSWKRIKQRQKLPYFRAMKAVEGNNIFGTLSSPEIPDSQSQTQDLTPSDADNVDLILTTHQSFDGRHTHKPNRFTRGKGKFTASLQNPTSQIGATSERNQRIEETKRAF